MIEGLKLTMTGDQIRARLDARIQYHREQRARWERGLSPDGDSEDTIQVPEQVCEHEAALHEWRAEVLAFIRDHADACETYRLTEADLEFAELLPAKPGIVEQAEHEERHELDMQVRRLARSIDALPYSYSEHPEFKFTKIDTQGGPEVVHIERREE